MLNTILIDSGPLIALFDRDDFYHNQIIDFIKNKKYKFISTIAVLRFCIVFISYQNTAQVLNGMMQLQLLDRLHKKCLLYIISFSFSPQNKKNFLCQAKAKMT